MSDKTFLQEMLCEFPEPDLEYQLYLKAWIIYHEAANLIDGNVDPRDRSPDARKLIGMAARSAAHEQARFMKEHFIYITQVDRTKWQRAKIEAVRLVERAYKTKMVKY